MLVIGFWILAKEDPSTNIFLLLISVQARKENRNSFLEVLS